MREDDPRAPCAGQEDPRHRAPVLHHVRDARWRAQVVLQHTEGALRVADQVDAGDVNAHAVGLGDAHRLAVKVLTRGDQAARDDPVAQNLLLAVSPAEDVRFPDRAGFFDIWRRESWPEMQGTTIFRDLTTPREAAAERVVRQREML